MKVLMFGWEFPPFSQGGLGTACEGLTKGLSNQGVKVTFVIPKAPYEATSDHVNLLVADNVEIENLTIKEINALFGSYMTPDNYSENLKKLKNLKTSGKILDNISMYGSNLFEEVQRYAEKAKLLAGSDNFDVIHAHDWMTFKAGKAAKEATGKPLIVHVHATEFDRTGGNPYQPVYNLEREGMHAADKILAVSGFTKSQIVKHYGIEPDKVEVVHNAVNQDSKHIDNIPEKREQMVLFLGRLTIQKGPDYFLNAAKRVLEKRPDVKFMIAGSGDMDRFVIDKAAELGISGSILHAGYLRGDDIDRAYRMADLYVMPSVSEPFGITPLESIKNDTPALISHQSGVSEVLTHCLKCDFWDIDEMSNKILAVLNYSPLKETLREEGKRQVNAMTWDIPAAKCINAYNQVINR